MVRSPSARSGNRALKHPVRKRNSPCLARSKARITEGPEKRYLSTFGHLFQHVAFASPVLYWPLRRIVGSAGMALDGTIVICRGGSRS